MRRNLALWMLSVLMSVVAPSRAQEVSYQGIWWAAPAGSESGWGINLTHQGDVIFATWFTYDAAGRSLWLVASLTRGSDGAFTGDFYQTSGPSYSSATFDAPRVAVARVGAGSLRFASPSSATFEYEIRGTRAVKSITPQVFRWLPTCTLGTLRALQRSANRSGLWWASPAGSESGWGMNVAHQGNSMFLTWFTYDADGEPLWLAATLQPTDTSWRGTLYRTNGPPFGAPFNSSAVTLSPVGGAILYFGSDGGFATENEAQFAYNLGSVSRTKRLTQQLFRNAPSVCDLVFTQSFLQDAMRSANISGLADGVRFATEYRLNAFQLASLLGVEPTDVIRYLRERMRSPLAGGATMEGYSQTIRNAVQVPADLSRQRYPADFTAAPASINAPDPYCSPSKENFIFPASYLGALPLPAIALTGNRQSFRRVLFAKDIWPQVNANFVPGCHSDPREVFLRTLARMQQLNADVVVLVPWTVIDRSASSWRVMNPAELNTSTMGDEDLAWAVAEIKRRGMSAFWFHQVQATRAGPNDYSQPEPTVANVLKTFDALESYFEERGAFLQRIGVSGVMLTSSTWMNPESILEPTQWAERTGRMLQKLRQGFSGSVWYNYSDKVAASPSVVSLIDAYMGALSGVSPNVAANPTLASLKAEYKTMVANMQRAAGSKPLYWAIGMASRRDVLTTGYVEESTCQPVAGNPAACAQDSMSADFSLQANAHEAAFEALFESQSPPLAIGVAFWMDDNLLPSYTYPHIANTVRGKPAEAIVYRWFAR